MRTNPQEYGFETPATLAAALETLRGQPGEWVAFAGGTELMVQFNAGRLPHRRMLNVASLPELAGLEVLPEKLVLGANCTFADLRHHPLIQREFPMLAQVASWIGGIANQNRATLGGNIANASPAADSPPALLAYEAELELVSARGTRTLPYLDFHLGYKRTALNPDELIRSIHLPRRFASWRPYVRKVGSRKAQAIAKVSLAAHASLENQVIRDLRIAFGSVAPVPVRALALEHLLTGRSPAQLLDDPTLAALEDLLQPIDDIRSTATYRRQVAANLLREFLHTLSTPANQLDRWNRASPAEAEAAILPCCGSPRWASRLAALRPFASADALLAASTSVWTALTPADWQEAFNTHPRIGSTHAPESATTQSRQWSAQEQSQIRHEDPNLTEALAEANRRYEARFNRVFLIRASGRTGEEILAALEARLASDPCSELREAAAQQSEITALRLRRWLAS